eukprot:g17119.t1
MIVSNSSTTVAAVNLLNKVGQRQRLGQPVARGPPTHQFQLPPDPPVSEGNELPVQKVYLHQLLNCDDRGAEFTSSGNSFYADFQPYLHNLHSVTICGQATMWYYETPDMDQRAILGGVRRCSKRGKVVPKSPNSCTCYDIPQGQGNLIESFTLEKPGEVEKRLAVARDKYERVMRTKAQGLQIFTDEGFTVYQGGLAALDPSLLRDIREFWLDNRLKAWAAKHDHFDPAVPWCKGDIWHKEMPTSLKERLEAAVRPALAEWVGLPAEDLVPTVTHGVRLYREGSWLGMHLDRRNTHAVSAILELGHLAYGYPADFYDLTDAE